MLEVSVHKDLTVLALHKTMLEAEGIPCFIRNESTPGLGAGMFGLVRSPIFDPVLCIVDDADHERAVAALREALAPPAMDSADWACPQCKESVPASFESCWNCQTSKPEP
jgi:hypothetical protein